ncbi:unnamed protein product [Acanthoscelides obtectus]|uniref:DUF4592 domain-containing protein n=1 Tax=Acanthoscelides obtectus TaxID=200917 RepID=A0A9P0JMP6_ACAOB|nr:unnamed protein product [Acanthoscelides obtectus]CAK1672967.1 hypothetical protein AOBTE_LOCUS29164 [Acanthoscelides obtectus]
MRTSKIGVRVATSNKRRFWNPKKWFRRKSSKVSNEAVAAETVETGKDALRSRSTSELSVVDEGRRRSSSSMHLGLSVSHDSVFHSPNSGSEIELDAAQSSSSLSTCQPHMDCRLQTELNARLRMRRGREDNSEDDEGFPYSSCNSPTTSDGLLLDKTAIKDLPAKSHSTCSDGSLLSMDSYEMDEDLSDPQSRYSSKLSLQEKKSNSDSLNEFGLKSSGAPLNHSAAHHRVAVKPKRTHGVPRRKKGQQLSSALPVTPEVNEDSSIRSISPESGAVTQKDDNVDTDILLSDTVTQLTEAQLKCSSLPPNIKGANDVINLNRSLSSAGSHDETQSRNSNEKTEEKLSLFDRIFPRKSNRKKKDKAKEEQEVVKQEEEVCKETTHIKNEMTDIIQTTHATSSKTQSSHSITISSTKHEVSHSATTHYTGSSSRQRLPPIDIPLSPSYTKKDLGNHKIVSESIPIGNPQIQTQLESFFKQKQNPHSSSPPMALYSSSGESSHPLVERSKPPLSPRGPSAVMSKHEDTSYQSTSVSSSITKISENKSRNEELRSKMKLPGLSSLQQRVLSLNDDVDDGFKSLTDFPPESGRVSKPLAKSQSFKSTKEGSTEAQRNNLKRTAQFLDEERKENVKSSFVKAVSLDSVKNLEEKGEFKRPKRDVYDGKSENEENPEECNVFPDSSITISGPSHTAVVNVTSDNMEEFNMNRKVVEESSSAVSVKEHTVSVTKIHLKQETQTSHTTNSVVKSPVPEFINKQLNKVDPVPASNIILSIVSPKVVEDPKPIFTFDEPATKPPSIRKFSKEDVEIIEKNDLPEKSVTSEANINLQPKFKKNEKSFRKSSVTSTIEFIANEKICLNYKSSSLDSLKSTSDKSSQDSLDMLVTAKERSVISEPVVLRKKSIATKKEEEPELMKVFARRSLKLKDSDVESLQDSLSDTKSRDSDKENVTGSPVELRNDCFKKPASDEKEVARRSIIRAASLEEKNSKDPLVEIKLSDKTRNSETNVPVAYRKMLNSNPFLGQRAMSASTPRTETAVKKQLSLTERRKTDQWITKSKDEEEKDEKLSDVKKDLTAESNNFSKRKAEWEKRAQLAQLKKSP